MAISLGLGACPHLEEGLSGPAPGASTPLDKCMGRGDRDFGFQTGKKLVAGTLNYPQTETGPYQILVMSHVRTQLMRAAGSKRTDSERPHIATYVLSPGWLSLSDHYSGDGTQKKD